MAGPVERIPEVGSTCESQKEHRRVRLPLRGDGNCQTDRGMQTEWAAESDHSRSYLPSSPEIHHGSEPYRFSDIHIASPRASCLYKAVVARIDALLLLATTIINACSSNARTRTALPARPPMRPLPKHTVQPAKWPSGLWVPQSGGTNVYDREEREALARQFIAHMDYHLFNGGVDQRYRHLGFSGIIVHALNSKPKSILGCADSSKGVIILYKDCKKCTERKPTPLSLVSSCAS
jgi:hypothetical protein